MQTHCDQCGGKGKTMAARCGTCRGQRLVNEKTSIDIDVDQGIGNGDTIVLPREGE